MKKLFILATFFLGLMATTANAQVTFQPRAPQSQGAGIVYDREFGMNFTLHSNGIFALGMQFGQLKTYYKTTFIHFKFGEIRHHKEHRQSFDNINLSSGRTSRSFIFGKQNSFFVLRGGYGEKRYFSEKSKDKGLAVGVSYQAGPSLGFIKPYYLELTRFSPDGSRYSISSEKYSQENSDIFLDVNRIFGSSPFSKGLGETTIAPGINAAIAAHFDWGAYDEFITALEFGIMADIFFREIPILVEEENRPLFINIYVNLQLGKRW